MYINPRYIAGILPLYPQGTNSTMYTECCSVIICDNQGSCPTCDKKVIGFDAETDNDRHKIRWEAATSHWNSKR